MLSKIGLFVVVLGAVSGLALVRADSSVAVTSARVAEVREQIGADYHAVLALQARARKQQDVIKLNCVNDKLIQVKAQMNLADTAGDEANAAAEAGTTVNEEPLREAAGAVRNLRQEAGACLGEFELGKQGGNTSNNPMFPDDPLVLPFDVYVEPPAYASPYN